MRPRSSGDVSNVSEIGSLSPWQLVKLFKDIFYFDARSVALFRVLISIILLVDLWIRFQTLEEFFTDDGVLPSSFVSTNIAPWSVTIHTFSGSYWFQLLLLIVTLVFTLMLFVGMYSRLSCLIVWALLVSAHNRNSLILNGGDLMLRMSVFWAMFLPLGRCYSIDDLRRRLLKESTRDDGEDKDNRNNEIRKNHQSATPASFAFIAQFFFVYLFTFGLKTGITWSEGSSIYYALNLDLFLTRTGYALKVLIEAMPPEVTVLLTRGTLWAELLMPFMLVSPVATDKLRLIAIFGFFMMHMGFGSCLRIGLFQFVPIACVLTFTPSLFWSSCWSIGSSLRRFFSRPLFSRSLGLILQRFVFNSSQIIIYDDDTLFCRRFITLFRRFFLFDGPLSFPLSLGTHFAPVQSSSGRHFSEEEEKVQTLIADHLTKKDSWFSVIPSNDQRKKHSDGASKLSEVEIEHKATSMVEQCLLSFDSTHSSKSYFDDIYALSRTSLLLIPFNLFVFAPISVLFSFSSGFCNLSQALLFPLMCNNQKQRPSPAGDTSHEMFLRATADEKEGDSDKIRWRNVDYAPTTLWPKMIAEALLIDLLVPEVTRWERRVFEALRKNASKKSRQQSKRFKKKVIFFCESVFVLSMLAFVTYWNHCSHVQQPVNPKVLWVGELLRIDQWWGMFSPNVPSLDQWFMVPALNRKGELVDAWPLNDNSFLPKPFPTEQFTYERWLKFMTNIADDEFADLREFFATYLCFKWNKEHTTSNRIVLLDIVSNERVINDFSLRGTPQPPYQPYPLYSYVCDASVDNEPFIAQYLQAVRAHPVLHNMPTTTWTHFFNSTTNIN